MLFDLVSKCIRCIFEVYMRQSCRKDMIQWWIKCECQELSLLFSKQLCDMVGFQNKS